MTDRQDSTGNIIFTIDYAGDGHYALRRGPDGQERLVRLARSTTALIRYITRTFARNPQVEFSDACELIWSLETTDGQKCWNPVLDEDG